MRVELVRIGNSHGVRLPKAVIAQAGLTDKLDLEVSAGSIIIRPAKKAREGWAEAAEACAAEAKDDLDDWDAAASDFDGDWE